MDFLRLPSQPGSQVFLLMLVFVGLFVAAVAVERSRRRNERRQQLRAAWAAAEEHIKAKDLTEDQAKVLHDVVQRHAPEHPQEAVTQRRTFNHCVAEHITALRSEGNDAAMKVHGRLLREVRTRLGIDFVPVGQRMESTREVNAEQLILAKAGTGGWFRLSVEEVDEAFLITIPRSGQDGAVPPKLAPGAGVECRMWRQDDARYRFRLELAEERKGPPRMVFHHAERIERLQARQYYRVRCNQPVDVGIINAPPGETPDDVSARPDLRQLRGRLVSISAGGLGVEVMAHLTDKELIRTTLRFQGFRPVTVVARVVGAESRGAGTYLVRAQFVSIDEETRDVVAQYVWQRQQPVAKA